MQNQEVGKIIELYYSKNNTKINTDELALDSKGVIEDKYYNKDIQRSVLITSVQSYELALANDIEMAYGSLGENLLIDYNPYHLKAGQRLVIGELVLEISQNCTMCKSLSKVDSQLPILLKNDRGIFAQVITNGVIHKGDNIYLLGRQ